MAFVVFRQRDCVTTTINELDLVKESLGDNAAYKALNIGKWEVAEAIPNSDIIWYNVSKILLRYRFT